MELEYVLKPYSQIAEHFDKTREYLWKIYIIKCNTNIY